MKSGKDSFGNKSLTLIDKLDNQLKERTAVFSNVIEKRNSTNFIEKRKR